MLNIEAERIKLMHTKWNLPTVYSINQHGKVRLLKYELEGYGWKRSRLV
jgi:hypothetical protein